ncbi:MAG: CreA family protein [Advenella sp.]
MKLFLRALLVGAAMLCTAGPANARAVDIGCVSTTWRILNNDKVCVQSFKDPQIDGVTCHLSYAKTGGVTGALGFAENPSRFSLSCRQTGPLKATQPVRKVQQDVFTQRMSFLFKGLNVSRLVDVENQSLIYLVVSEKLIDGSPFNSISVVPLMPWREVEPAITFK